MKDKTFVFNIEELIALTLMVQRKASTGLYTEFK